MEHRQHFEEHGYVRLPQALSPETMAAIERSHARLDQLASDILQASLDSGQSLASYYADEPHQLIAVPERDAPTQVCRYEYIARHDRTVREQLVPTLQSFLQQLTGERYELFKDKCNAKNPGGGAFAPHQDVIAYDSFAPTFHVTAALFLDPATLENGCLYFPLHFAQTMQQLDVDLPWTETPMGPLPVLPSVEGGPDHGSIVPAVGEALQWQPIETQPGDLVLFDSYVPHYSEPNHSAHKRRALFFTFNPASDGNFYEQYYAKKHAEYDNPAFHVATPTAHAEL